MPAIISGGGATKPNQVPTGVNGTTIATSKAISDEADSTGSGQLRHGRPLVRMTKITRICVAVDSRTRGTECLRSNVEIASQQRERGNVKQ